MRRRTLLVCRVHVAALIDQDARLIFLSAGHLYQRSEAFDWRERNRRSYVLENACRINDDDDDDDDDDEVSMNSHQVRVALHRREVQPAAKRHSFLNFPSMFVPSLHW